MDPPIPPLARLTARRQGCLRGVQWMRQCEIRLHHVFTHPNWSWEPTFQVLRTRFLRGRFGSLVRPYSSEWEAALWLSVSLPSLLACCCCCGWQQGLYHLQHSHYK